MLSNFKSGLFLLCAFLSPGAYSLTYDDLQALGVSCPEVDKCEGYRNDRSFATRNCECDSKCSYYGDCCIDANIGRRRNPVPRTTNNFTCLNYGNIPRTGVYVVSTCRSSWNGPTEIAEKCVGPVNMRDPLTAAPVTSVSRIPDQSTTYRNRFCAECNHANMTSLKTFHIGIVCDGSQNVTEEQILGDITYNEELASWGIYRLNSEGTENNFVACSILFDVPPSLNNSVRFCRSNLTSTCASDWTRQVIQRNCDEYMAVVYDEEDVAYRNPHCAMCNQKSVADVKCLPSVSTRKTRLPFAAFVDINQSDGGDEVGTMRVATPECASNQIYDPFGKMCRPLACGLPGYEMVNGRCANVRG